jgi:translation initiation factor IF-3
MLDVHVRYGHSTAKALYQVFVAPMVCNASSRAPTRHNSKDLLYRQRPYASPSLRRSFAQSAILETKTREPERRTQKWDEEITAKLIQLVDPETNQLPRDPVTQELIDSTRTRYDVLNTLDRTTHRLVQLSPDEPDNRRFVPVCKIVNKKEAFDQEKRKKTQAKERHKESVKANTVKTLELNWAIDGNDLAHRLERVGEFLSDGRKVEIVLAAKKRGRKATQAECQDVLGKIQRTLAAVPGAKEVKPLDGKLGSFATMVLQGRALAQSQLRSEDSAD